MRAAFDCGRWEDAISARLDGHLPPIEARQLDLHLAVCSDCRGFDSDACALHGAVRVRPAEPVPDLVDAILAQNASDPPRRGHIAASAAAVAVLVLVAGVAALTSTSGDAAMAPAIARIDGVATAARPGTSAAVYLSVVNEGGDDRIIGARTSAAEDTVLHATEKRDGVVVMTRAADRPIAADSTTILGPGGPHVMLTGVHGALEPGQEIEVTLDFARSESRTIRVPVVGAAEVPGDLRISAT